MSRVRVVCPPCGAEPQLLPAAIRVLVVGESDEVRDGSAYHFICPACGTRVVKAADVRVVKLLSAAGCPITVTGSQQQEQGTVTSWVGRMVCGHDIAGITEAPPAPGGWQACDWCERTRELVDVIVGRKVAA